MAQPARRRRTQPALSSVSTTQPPEPPDPPADPPEAAEDEDMVTCFLSGARIHKRDAVQVRLGPGRRMWMAKELTSSG